jgi:hypothetical protein
MAILKALKVLSLYREHPVSGMMSVMGDVTSTICANQSCKLASWCGAF